MYAADNLFEAIFGKTYALELVPDAKIISESYSDGGYSSIDSFSISIGFILVLAIALLIFAFDFEKYWLFHPLKTIVILAFFVICVNHFIGMQGGNVDFSDVPLMSLNFGYVLGIIAFSYLQSVQIPSFIADSTPE